jgi:hypothetical protein
MNHAYNQDSLYNITVIKESKKWCNHGFIDEIQLKNIESEYTCSFYHPNIFIRILLFLATLLALSGVTGLLVLIFGNTQVSESLISFLCFFYGLALFVITEKLLIGEHHHFKSGVTESLLYHACAFVIVGISWMADFNVYIILIACLLVFSFSAVRYLDLITTAASMCSLASIIFYFLYEAGGTFQQVIPFVFIVSFGSIYVIMQKAKAQQHSWSLNIMIAEAISLLLVYAAGNYLVVRELSINVMGLEMKEGQDIPFAYLFYTLTVMLPLSFLYAGIKRKDSLILRVSLITTAFTALTFKYYYGFGHPEISLTVAGALLFSIAILLFNYLKKVRNGFTRENHLVEKWANLNLQAFVVSQTLGGDQSIARNTIETGGGGKFGGGGSTDSF